ncbi:hypothetical protein GY45DRAFT_1228577, partial [Cubamyces sp. BRFM 1775]
GPSMPRGDRDCSRERYCRLMLLLFKPWRQPQDLVVEGCTWEQVFSSAEVTLNERHKHIMENMQLLHECKDSRDD